MVGRLPFGGQELTCELKPSPLTLSSYTRKNCSHACAGREAEVRGARLWR